MSELYIVKSVEDHQVYVIAVCDSLEKAGEIISHERRSTYIEVIKIELNVRLDC